MIRNLFIASLALALFCQTGLVADHHEESALAHKAKTIDGKEVNLAEKYKGKVVLIVNVASKCGATPQYAGLQKLHDQYKEKGFELAGFPCNQFGMQEPGSEEEIKEFCEETYKVKFDMYSKVDVNGDKAHPLYKYLTGDTVGIEDKGNVKWNFEKFLVGKDGKVIKRYRTRVTPDKIVADIEAALAAK